MKKKLAEFANVVLRPLGAELTKYDWTWDEAFKEWVQEAAATGEDPNDVGNKDWADDPLRISLNEYYLPYVPKDSVAFELGPGTGRLTRHIISRCTHVILADYSAFACRWLPKYLKGKGSFELIHLNAPSFPAVENDSVDVVLANCVFDHISFDEMYAYFSEFYRILRRGGIASFNFINIMSQEALDHFKQMRESGFPCVFQYHHPEVVVRLAEDIGFVVQRLETVERYAYVIMDK